MGTGGSSIPGADRFAASGAEDVGELEDGFAMQRLLVTGAAGLIGHHLVTYVKERGHRVRGVDVKYPEYTEVGADEFEILDLRQYEGCFQATRGIDQVFSLAADMGGMGFISQNHATICATTP